MSAIQGDSVIEGQMIRWFNTAGVCVPADHYMLPALRRLPDARQLIDQKSYFVVHAPRQVGKTTALLSLANELTAEGRYAAVLVSMIVGAGLPTHDLDDLGRVELALLDSVRQDAEDQLPPELLPPPWPEASAGNRIGAALRAWAKASPRPLVLFVDEIDALRDTVLVSILRQLQAGYRSRPRSFPWSLALIGLRDVRDYRIGGGPAGERGTPSPFNIVVESLTLRNFTEDEVAELYQQHTDEVGQRFEPEAVARVFALTQGQPWLVNALARQLVEVVVPDRARSIRAADVDRAKEILIARRDTHLDSLVDRLTEPRVQTIIEPMIAGTTPEALPRDDVRFAIDLGLVRVSPEGGIEVANPIYREIIVRELASVPRAAMPQVAPTWLRPDSRLDPDRLLDAFIAFWCQHGEPLLKTAPYHEIAPHLVLMAFLDRVANGGGTLEREYAIGRGRMDLCLRYGPDVIGMELKVWRSRRPDPLGEGLEQLDGYLAGLGAPRGWLVIFDCRSGLPPIPERTTVERTTSPSGREITVIRA